MKMTRYGYARVSTLKQDLTEQIDEIKSKGVSQNNIFAEKITGTKSNRPQWLKLMNVVKSGDEIIVTKLDRLGRSLQIILKEIDQLTAKKVTVTVGNMTFDRSTPQGKLMLNIMGSFAEFERDMIVDRMQGARAYKRKTDPNYREGRKRKITPAMQQAMREYYKTHTQKETAQAFNISPRSVGNYMGKPKKD
ncbi:recombinase family protein [Limosilactobacillus reuteri]|nr:recombinase family protein [Limosilactobacillus reuteri]